MNDVPDDILEGKAFLLGVAAAPGDCARRGKSTCSPQVQRIRGPLTDSSFHNSDASELEAGNGGSKRALAQQPGVRAPRAFV